MRFTTIIVAVVVLAGAAAAWFVLTGGPVGADDQGKVVEGTEAPDFTAPWSEGGDITLSSLRGQVVVLYFYPMDDTPGCTVEARGFRDADKEMVSLGVVVLGISEDDMESHGSFIKKYELNFPLVSDADGSIMTAWGVWKTGSAFGKSRLGLDRSTFVVDRKGIVRKVWRDVVPEGHAEAVLAWIRENLPADDSQ